MLLVLSPTYTCIIHTSVLFFVLLLPIIFSFLSIPLSTLGLPTFSVLPHFPYRSFISVLYSHLLPFCIPVNSSPTPFLFLCLFLLSFSLCSFCTQLSHIPMHEFTTAGFRWSKVTNNHHIRHSPASYYIFSIQGFPLFIFSLYLSLSLF